MKTVNVVAAIIFDAQKENILISQRHQDAHQGGLWEFPGGKVEQGETAQQALQREIKEEINLDVSEIELFHYEAHSYPDKKVSIQFFSVYEFSGEPKALEGQPLEWVAISDLEQRDFPAANNAVKQKLISAY